MLFAHLASVLVPLSLLATSHFTAAQLPYARFQCMAGSKQSGVCGDTPTPDGIVTNAVTADKYFNVFSCNKKFKANRGCCKTQVDKNTKVATACAIVPGELADKSGNFLCGAGTVYGVCGDFQVARKKGDPSLVINAEDATPISFIYSCENKGDGKTSCCDANPSGGRAQSCKFQPLDQISSQ